MTSPSKPKFTYAAVYEGPGGPISRTFEAASDAEAVLHVRQNRLAWYNDSRDDLALPVGAHGAQVQQALEDRDPSYSPVELPASLDEWELYRFNFHGVKR
jgi:hypothetical protein